MPVRIYSLAKDLKVDSKELVDLCKKAGITGKGSALASLTDEEAQRMTEYVRNMSAGPAAAPARPQVVTPVREAVRETAPVAPIREVPVSGSPRRSIGAPLSTTRPGAARPEGRSGDAAAQRPQEQPLAVPPPPPTPEELAKRASFGSVKPVAEPVAEVKPVAEAPPQPQPTRPERVERPERPVRPERPETETRAPLGSRPGVLSGRNRGSEPMEPIRRDPSGPMSGAKIRVLGRTPRREGDAAGGGAGPKPNKRREPVINLAALPEARRRSVAPRPMKLRRKNRTSSSAKM